MLTDRPGPAEQARLVIAMTTNRVSTILIIARSTTYVRICPGLNYSRVMASNYETRWREILWKGLGPEKSNVMTACCCQILHAPPRLPAIPDSQKRFSCIERKSMQLRSLIIQAAQVSISISMASAATKTLKFARKVCVGRLQINISFSLRPRRIRIHKCTSTLLIFKLD